MERMEDKIVSTLGNRLEYFNINGCTNFNKNNLICICATGLLDNLKEYIDKYLSISIRKDCEFIGLGSSAAVFRIGDYAFKLINKKYSVNRVICPDLFLIVKTYERDYVRCKMGRVTGGIEVQPYLSRTIEEAPKDILKAYNDELKKLKYRINDNLIDGKYGDNVMLLDSYKDADYENPEELPDWFKENPVVLIDRDLVFKAK